MNELEVGMYVRTDRGKIGKFVKNVKCYFELEYQGWCDLIFKNRCLKASYDPIDLIEVGDYVNGLEVVAISEFKDGSRYIEFDEGRFICKNYQIKSIVTKEQFDSMKYEI